MAEVAEGVHHFDDGVVNWYLIDDGGRLTLVDAGFAGGWKGFAAGLERIGRRPGDVEAVVVTHAHIDHIGFAERARRECGATVWVHPADESTTRRPKTLASSERSALSYLGQAATRRLFLHATLQRGSFTPGVRELRTFADGDVLDVPGRPLAIHTPGHTDGHTAFLMPDRGVLFAGDAIVMRDPYTGRSGPCLVARGATRSTPDALASLDRIAALEAEVVLTGHGDPWRGPAAAAAERARAAGVA